MTIRKIRIALDSDVLKEYPFLDNLEKQIITPDRVNSVMNALESRPEGFRVSFINDTIRIGLRLQKIEASTDYLGLPKIEGKLKEICEIVASETHSDPRKEIYYDGRSSILAGSDLSDNALIQPNCLPQPGRMRKRHPLDRISTEEIAKRRQLADQRWEDVKQERKRQKKPKEDKEITRAKEFFNKKTE